MSALRAHAEVCPECRAAIEDERRLSALIQMGDDPVEPSADPPARRVERVLYRLRLSRARKRWLVAWSVTAAILICVGGLSWGMREGSSPISSRNPSHWGEDYHELEQQTIERLDAVAAVYEETWLLEELETVMLIDRLISAGNSNRP
jgi:hypothetical protein